MGVLPSQKIRTGLLKGYVAFTTMSLPTPFDPARGKTVELLEQLLAGLQVISPVPSVKVRFTLPEYNTVALGTKTWETRNPTF